MAACRRFGVEKRHGNVMARPPRPVDEGLPSGKDIALIFYLGAVMVIGTLIVFFLAGGGVYGLVTNVRLHRLPQNLMLVFQ